MNYTNSSKKNKQGADFSSENSIFNVRIYILFFLLFSIGAVITLKLFSLQVSAHDYFKALADNQHSILKDLVPRRGEIYLRDKDRLYPVAVNKDTKMAYAVPKEIKNASETARALSSLLNLPENEIFERLNDPEDVYEPIKHRLTDNEILGINSLKLDGVHLLEENYRYYPAGELASHVLGFVGWRDNDLGGRYGAEAYFESALRGEQGALFQNKDNSGRWISTGEKQLSRAKNGDNLVLTIDHSIQYETEKILKSGITKFEADRGTIIVMESQTGKILAMASFPDFNPNEYKNIENMESFRNLSVSDPYECGSVFKAITLAAAIDSGKINSNTTYTDTGQVIEAGYVIKNSDFKSNGVQTMTEVLEKSLNTGAIYAEKMIGNKNFADYVKRFGFGSITDINLPGESAGNIANLNNLKSDIQFYTASFGQGITVTPIQLISAYNAIANSGVLLKPRIVDKIIHDDGSQEDIQTEEVKRVISQTAANEVSQMLRSVVENGHGKMAGVPGYAIGGKTGTAQVASNEKKGYVEGTNIGSFAGFAPIINPQFTILVRMDNPKSVEWAESSAAPAFGELMKFLLEYRNIEPTEEFLQKDLDYFSRTHTLSKGFLEKKEKNEEGDNKGEEAEENNNSGQ